MTVFEEYKLFVEDTARFSERRQTITNTYITINGAIAGWITFLVKDSRLMDWWLVVAILPLIVFGVFVCSYWRQLILRYKQLVGLRVGVLREIEMTFPDSMQMYHREDKLYPRDAQNQLIQGKGLNFSDLEVRLPLLFTVLYLVLWLSLVVGTLLVTTRVLASPVVLPARP